MFLLVAAWEKKKTLLSPHVADLRGTGLLGLIKGLGDGARGAADIGDAVTDAASLDVVLLTDARAEEAAGERAGADHDDGVHRAAGGVAVGLGLAHGAPGAAKAVKAGRAIEGF
jgi:hypothetical protein